MKKPRKRSRRNEKQADPEPETPIRMETFKLNVHNRIGGISIWSKYQIRSSSDPLQAR